MKICYLGNAKNLHVNRWMRYFAEAGYEVHIVSDVPADIKGVVVHDIGDPNIPLYIPFVSALYQMSCKTIRIRKVLRSIKPDVLHAHWATNYGFLAALSGFHPFVLTVHGSDILVDPEKSRISRFFVQHALRKADLVTSVAEHISEKLEKFGVSAEKTATFQYGVDTEIFKPDEGALEKNFQTIISLRDFEARYNMELLIRAIPGVVRRFPQAKFILLGRGPLEEELRGLIDRLGIRESIAFFGWCPHERVLQFLRASGIYVSTASTDGCSIALLEAMACGLFPIVTDLPANREWITDGRNGFLVLPYSPKALSEKLCQAIDNPDLRLSARLRNVALVREKASWRDNLGGMKAYYYRLKKRTPVRQPDWE